jgi:hypothetical protein
MSYAYDEPQFCRAIAKLLRNFNLLDTNIGLCLSHLLEPNDPQSSYPRLSRMTSQARFEELRRLVIEGAVALPKRTDHAPFEQWFEDATWARELRNRFFHGNWEYLPHRKEGPVGVSAPAWMRERLGLFAEERMTLASLEALADRVADIFDRFMQIRRTYGI